jgi:sensor histidine kinase YesM
MMKTHRKQILTIQLLLLLLTSFIVATINTFQGQKYIINNVFTSNKNNSSIISEQFNNYLLITENHLKSLTPTLEVLIEEYDQSTLPYHKIQNSEKLYSQIFQLINDNMGFESITLLYQDDEGKELFFEYGDVKKSINRTDEISTDTQLTDSSLFYITDPSNPILDTCSDNSIGMVYQTLRLTSISCLNLSNPYLKTELDDSLIYLVGDDYVRVIQGHLSNSTLRKVSNRIQNEQNFFIEDQYHVSSVKTINDASIITFNDITELNHYWYRFLTINILFSLLISVLSFFFFKHFASYITGSIENLIYQIKDKQDFNAIDNSIIQTKKNWVSRFIENLPIRLKIFFYLFISVTVPFIIMISFSIINLTYSIQDRTDFSNHLLTELTANNINDQLNLTEDTLDLILVDDLLQLYLIGQEDYMIRKSGLTISSISQAQLNDYMLEPFDNEESTTYVKVNTNTLTDKQVIKKSVDYGLLSTLAHSITFFDVNGNVLINSNQFVSYPLDLETIGEFNYQDKYITLTKQINSIYPITKDSEHSAIIQQKIGYAQLVIDPQDIKAIYHQLGHDSKSVVMNRDEPIYFDLNQESEYTQIPNHQVYKKEIRNDWYFVTSSHHSIINEEITTIVLMNLSLLLFLIFMIMTISMVLSKRMTKQLAFIDEQIHSIQDFEQFLYINSRNDEINLLVNSFNTMLERLNHLAQKVQEQTIAYQQLEVTKTEAELIAYQTQVNPHFLFNVFASINIMIKKDRSNEASEMLMSVAKMLKLSIFRNETTVPLNDEVEHLKAYSKIQQIRFKDRIVFDMDIDPNLLNTKMQKFILQPLVENAYHHGVEPIGYGHIKVSITKIKDHLCIMIKDNGKGMDVDRLNKVKYIMSHFDYSEHLGLANVNQRVKIFYGNQYGIEISSKLNKGTLIKLVIPIIY